MGLAVLGRVNKLRNEGTSLVAVCVNKAFLHKARAISRKGKGASDFVLDT